MARRAANKSFFRRAANKVPSWVRRASAVIGPIGALAALIIGIRDLGDLSGPRWAEVLAWAGVLLVVVAITTIYLEQYRHEIELGDYLRNAQVAVALPVLHEAFHTLRDASYSIREGNSDEAQLTLLIKSLDHVAMAFSSITGAPCRMCVKLLIAADDAPGEVTLSADADSADERWFNVKTLYRHDGSHDPAKDGPTPLYRNSDFRQVWDQKHNSRCFFSTDLDAEPNYLNDHRVGDPNNFEYNSAIVWPIQKKKHGGNVDLIGYLCLDSLQKNTFQYNNDFYLGAAYADSLYMVLVMRRQQTPQPEQLANAATSSGSIDDRLKEE